MYKIYGEQGCILLNYLEKIWKFLWIQETLFIINAYKYSMMT